MDKDEEQNAGLALSALAGYIPLIGWGPQQRRGGNR